MGFIAVTRIKYSNPNILPGETVDVVEFEQGDEVKGLPKEIMKELWEAGALERTNGEATKEEESAPSTLASDGETPPPPPPTE